MSYSVIRFALSALTIALALWGTTAFGQEKNFIIDMTHPIPTFEPSPIGSGALGKPIMGSKPIASFSPQAVIIGLPRFPTGDGHFVLQQVVLPEHHGTHLDPPGHFVLNKEATESASPDTRTVDKLTDKDLMGPAVVIDISRRVQAELDKNGGKPSPDLKVTGFSDASGNVVTAADINALAGQLENGSWVIMHSGWAQFYWQSGPGLKGPFINGLNWPGFSRAAIDRLIEIEERKGIKINGVGVDQPSPESNLGTLNWKFGKGSFYVHVRGLQRGWKIVENLANTDLLAGAKPGSCELVVGALKHIGGYGGAARIFAFCGK